MSKETENAIASVPGTGIAQNIPNLNELEVAPIELVGEYWSPTEKGESKRVAFYDFNTQTVIEQATGENRDLNVVRFVEITNDGLRLIRNGSARLVGQFEQMARNLNQFDPFLIVYQGKTKTTTGKLADSWQVFPLVKKQ